MTGFFLVIRSSKSGSPISSDLLSRSLSTVWNTATFAGGGAVPCDCDGMRRWESFLFITSALRAYVARKPLAARTEPAWPRVIALASRHLVSPAIGIVLLRERSIPDGVK